MIVWFAIEFTCNIISYERMDTYSLREETWNQQRLSTMFDQNLVSYSSNNTQKSHKPEQEECFY